MSKAKHSPGPWRIDGVFADGIEVGVLDGEGNEILGIAPFDGVDLDQWGDRSLANARLVAAAPDLLEALKAARETVYIAVRANLSEDLYDSKEEYRAAILNHITVKQCDAAIAKAEGRA